MRKAIATVLTIALTALALQTNPARAQTQTGIIATTKHFEFHSNPWLNLHHFLFNIAKDHHAGGLRKYLTDSGLSDTQATVFDDAASFYRDNYIDNSLLFNRDLFALKRLLIATAGNEDITLDGYTDVATQLRRARPIYDEHFWPAHRRANQRILDDNLELASELEDCVFMRIANLSKNQWPDRKVRVDLTYVANWAGAYTTVNPIVHAVIRSSGWESQYDCWKSFFTSPLTP